MTKYRRLTIEELSELEKEFIDFLVVNGIVAADWVKIKKEDNDAAELILDKFSDVIFEASMRKSEYVQFIAQKSIKCFQCLADKIVLVGMDAGIDSNIDFIKQIDWEQDSKDIKVYTVSKDYKESREKEIFNLIQSGASLSDGSLFKKICLTL